MAYEAELDKTLKLNIVVSIDGVFYAMRAPDSGLSITSEFLQLQAPTINGVNVDIRSSNTPISTFSFKLMEYEFNKTSSKVMIDETQLLEKNCIVYVGFITGSFDFADYRELARTKISSVSKIANGYSFTSKEVSHLIARPALNRSDILKTFILSTSTTLSITDTTDWPTSGVIRIDQEFINYTGKDIDGITLTGLTRGLSLGGSPSTAAEHQVGAEVFQVTSLVMSNPVDMILQILLSKNGDLTNDPTYDVLENGLGISPANVNIAGIESIRDTFFLGEEHSLFIWGATDMMKYLEKFLLPSTSLRFVTSNGKINLSLLDQVNFNEAPPVIDESSIIGVPMWNLSSDKLVNVIEAQWDYNFARGKYERIEVYKDFDSIATFGEKRALQLLMPSVRSSLNGATIATQRAGRLLGRLSTARGKVELSCHFDKSDVQVGTNVQIIHRYLPQQGGTLGFSDQLEVMSRSIDLDKAVVRYKLEFTSYTGIRIPFIGPSPKIVSVVNQRTFTVTDASCLTIGDHVTLFKDGPIVLGAPTAGSYLPDSFRVIEFINGNEITVNSDFDSTLGNDITVKLPDYDEATISQKAKYAFVGSNTGFFNDGSKSYQIIF
jgi:hypothetical protein